MANTTEQSQDIAIVKRGELLVQDDPGCCISTWCCCAFCVADRWSTCYIVLQQGALSIYANENDIMPRDIVNLYGSAVVLPIQPKVTRSNCIEVLTPKRSVYMCARTAADVQDWALAIQKAAILETSGKLVVPPLLQTQNAAYAASVPPPSKYDNPHAHARAAHEAKSGAASAAVSINANGAVVGGGAFPKAKPNGQSIALSPRSSLLSNELRSDS